MHKLKIAATIPTVQYGNIQPEIELEGENLEELNQACMEYIEGVWAKYGSSPLKTNVKIGGSGSTFKEVDTFTGEKILYDAENHKYLTMEGKPMLSGSAYADQFGKKFDSAMMIPKTAKAWGVDEKMLGELWALNAKVSTEYGSALHTALEIYHRYGKMGETIKAHKKLDANYCLPKNEHIRDIVVAFVTQFGIEALPEVFVSDVKNLRVGQIDRLEIVDADKKVCRVGDYKSNNEMTKEKMLHYQHQLCFYAAILATHGWTIEGLDIFHYNGAFWEKTELPVLDINETPA